jgi:hypothetical protein
MLCDFATVLFVWTLLCGPTLGWGDVGHRTVAYVAEHYLTKHGTDFLNHLLPHNDKFDISDAATWADEIKRHRPKTKPWHYVGMSRFSLVGFMNVNGPSKYRCGR